MRYLKQYDKSKQSRVSSDKESEDISSLVISKSGSNITGLLSSVKASNEPIVAILSDDNEKNDKNNDEDYRLKKDSKKKPKFKKFKKFKKQQKKVTTLNLSFEYRFSKL